MFKVVGLAIFCVSLFGLMSAQSAFNMSELCSLAPNSKILKPNSCRDWFKCRSSPGVDDMEEGSCVFGMYFNKNTGKCEDQDSVACPFETNATDNRCSGAADGTFLADPEHCNAYIYCRGGKEMRGFCQNNLIFHPAKSECVYENQYTCSNSTKAGSGLICQTLREGEFFADKNDCTKYRQCRQDVVVTHSCNSSYAWSYIERRCLPVDDVVCYPTAKKPEPELKVCIDNVGPISDGVSCSGYYFCKKVVNGTYDRKPRHFSCSPGTFFDLKTLSCRDRLNVKCSLDRCEGMGNKYVNIAGDCRAYALCAKGVASTQGICPNNYYFDERTQGCTPQVVSYAACTA